MRHRILVVAIESFLVATHPKITSPYDCERVTVETLKVSMNYLLSHLHNNYHGKYPAVQALRFCRNQITYTQRFRNDFDLFHA